jgi:hypothetical protein
MIIIYQTDHTMFLQTPSPDPTKVNKDPVSKLPIESNPIDCETDPDCTSIASPAYPGTTLRNE